jgi:8-oxo-dGTP pyrophosphatase MutT (NUDIX family)
MHNQKIQERLRAARRFDPAAHVPLLCDGKHIGWLRKSAAQRLMAWPGIFKRDAAGVRIAESLTGAEARTAAIAAVIETLHREGAITGWRNERYAVVTAFDASPLFHIERAAARFLGTTTYAAHANGYCGSGVDCEIWLARRSATKPIDPGMLDNLIGGGMSAGTPPMRTIIKEAWEEAGIPVELARKAVVAGMVTLLREVPEGVQSEVIFVHDLELPRDFQPHNEDGEVAEFRRVAIGDVIEMLHGEVDITLDASLVMLNFLARRGYLENALPGCGDVVSFSD